MATDNGRKTGTTRKTSAAKSAPRKRSTAAKPAEKASVAKGTLAAGIGAGVLAAGALGLAQLFRRGTFDKLLGRGNAEHPAPDLTGDAHPDGSERAPVDFRPDPTAPIPASERDAFRPALAGASAPTLVRGEARELDRLDASPS